MPDIVSFGALTAGAANVGMQIPSEETRRIEAQVQSHTRRGRAPQFDALVPQPTKLVLDINQIGGTTPSDTDNFDALVYQACRPRSGLRTLTATNPLTSDPMTLGVYVVAVSQPPNTLNTFRVELEAMEDCWSGPSHTSGAAAASNTLNYVGTVDTYPVITLSPDPTGPKLNKYQIAITDNSGRGLYNYWVRVVIQEAEPTGHHCRLRFKHRDMAFNTEPIDTANHYLDFCVNVPPSGQSNVVYYVGGAIDGTIYHNRIPPIVDEADTAVFGTAMDNEHIHYRFGLPGGMSSSPGNMSHAWVPSKSGKSVSGAPIGIDTDWDTFILRGGSRQSFDTEVDSLIVTYGTGATWLRGLKRTVAITPPAQSAIQTVTLGVGASSGTFRLAASLGQTGDLAYNVSAAAMQTALQALFGTGNVTVARAGTNTTGDPYIWTITWIGDYADISVPTLSTALNSTGQTITVIAVQGGAPAGGRAFIRVRAPGSALWQTVWETTENGVETADVQVAVVGISAVSIAVGIEPLRPDADLSLTLEGTQGTGAVKGFTVELDATLTPTVDIITSVDAFYSGAVNIINPDSGSQITFEDLLLDGSIIINCETQDITNGTASDWDGEPIYNRQDDWITLTPGTNNVTVTSVGGSTFLASWTWVDKYAI